MLKFRPVSPDGLLLRHTGSNRDFKLVRTSKVKVSGGEVGGEGDQEEEEEYVALSLDNEELLVSVLLNGSDPLVIHAGMVKVRLDLSKERELIFT